jgi:hypothetical protein
MAYFYEIRSADNTLLKRDGGFGTQDAAKIAGREHAKKVQLSLSLEVFSCPYCPLEFYELGRLNSKLCLLRGKRLV